MAVDCTSPARGRNSWARHAGRSEWSRLIKAFAVVTQRESIYRKRLTAVAEKDFGCEICLYEYPQQTKCEYKSLPNVRSFCIPTVNTLQLTLFVVSFLQSTISDFSFNMKFFVALSVFASLVLSAPLEPRSNNRCPDYCAGTNFNKTLSHIYLCGDFRLGPVRLPTNHPIADLVDNYDRFGGLCPGDFITKWWSIRENSYNYPTQQGFSIDTAGKLIQGTVTLKAGVLLDRFGFETGEYVSPQGAPYEQRAIPPSNLNTPDGVGRFVNYQNERQNADLNSYIANYHVYRVVKDFDALAGPILPWFEQPGQGVQ